MTWTHPQKGKVTRKAALDLYHNTLTIRNKTVTWHLIGLLLKGCGAEKAVEFKNLVTGQKKKGIGFSFMQDSPDGETVRQTRALNNTIFGKHYSVDTYENLMIVLYQIELEKQKQGDVGVAQMMPEELQFD